LSSQHLRPPAVFRRKSLLGKLQFAYTGGERNISSYDLCLDDEREEAQMAMPSVQQGRALRQLADRWLF
jgi:hypothetical protein